MKTYTRKQAEKVLSSKGKFWVDCHDLHRINNEALKNNDKELYRATLDLNGHVLGY